MAKLRNEYLNLFIGTGLAVADTEIEFYSDNAESLFEQYEGIDSQELYQDWLKHIPDNGFVLDVGCGSGRDAAFLAEKGLFVTAVEPATKMLEVAKQKHIHANITWMQDKLPELSKVFKLQIKYDLILLGAVWMHIAPSNRERAVRKLSSLLKPNGKIVITLRHGPCNDGRQMHQVSADEINKFSSKFGLRFSLLNSANHGEDKLGRIDVSWQTVILQLPDDGTGAFPLIRNIVINDQKAATYKIALLRTILRIAEGHPGAVIEQTDEHIVLPLGLVALYWLKLYKPLIDQHQIQQNGNPNSGLGFIKKNGWELLTQYVSDDFYVGAHYNDPSFAQIVARTINQIAGLIGEMPVTHITIPGSEKQVFEIEKQTYRPKKKPLRLNAEFFTEIGKFIVPKHIWNSFVQHSVWIEPTLVNEWHLKMAGLKGNIARKDLTQQVYLEALKWTHPQRSTNHVRSRVKDLIKTQDVHCVWTEKRINRAKTFDIDHAFPFSRWPNNDLWNLLPTTSKANSDKSDKLPSMIKLQNAREHVLNWWHQGWENNQDEFFEQANLALPNLSLHNRNYEDVFEAMKLQRNRIKDFQQLDEWG